jgi:hypothetical protein
MTSTVNDRKACQSKLLGPMTSPLSVDTVTQLPQLDEDTWWSLATQPTGKTKREFVVLMNDRLWVVPVKLASSVNGA